MQWIKLMQIGVYIYQIFFLYKKNTISKNKKKSGGLA